MQPHFLSKAVYGKTDTHLHLLLAVLGRVLAALALSAKLLQFSLTLLQTLPFVLVLDLVFLQRRLRTPKTYH